MSGISPEVLAALRASLAAQTRELDELRDALRSLQQERDQEVHTLLLCISLARKKLTRLHCIVAPGCRS